MDMENAVVMVTGASSGIGAATARAAARSGARVVVLARRQDRLDALAAEFGDQMLAVVCDVTSAQAVAQAVQAAIGAYGRIDVLVNNAGQGLHAAIENIAIDDFRDLLDLNSVAPLRMMQAVIPHMRRQGGGRIVNVSSGATLSTYAGSAAYTSSKAALNMLSNVARLELADAGIVVSTLYPSITATEFYRSVKSGAQAAQEQEAGTRSLAQSPELVARTILALIRSGDAQADLVPKAYGGSFEG